MGEKADPGRGHQPLRGLRSLAVFATQPILYWDDFFVKMEKQSLKCCKWQDPMQRREKKPWMKRC